MRWAAVLLVITMLGGCSGNQAAKPESTQGKPSTAVEETPADPYAAMEAERNAVKESLAGKVSETPEAGGNNVQRVYTGVVEIIGKGSPNQNIVLKTNRGSFVLVGDKRAELVASEGKFITVMGKPTKGNAVPDDLKDLEQIAVEGIVTHKLGK
jgi:hypothetical protein